MITHIKVIVAEKPSAYGAADMRSGDVERWSEYLEAYMRERYPGIGVIVDTSPNVHRVGEAWAWCREYDADDRDIEEVQDHVHGAWDDWLRNGAP